MRDLGMLAGKREEAMFDPNEKVMRQVPENETGLTKEQRSWTKFQEGEEVQVKGVTMRIHEIGESRVVLKFK